jgi:hypothetical protein
MENNPMHSKDATYGIPKAFLDTLQEISEINSSIQHVLVTEGSSENARLRKIFKSRMNSNK